MGKPTLEALIMLLKAWMGVGVELGNFHNVRLVYDGSYGLTRWFELWGQGMNNLGVTRILTAKREMLACS